MKNLLLVLFALLTLQTAKAQGLENIIVETYYIAEPNDATVNSSGGVLPIPSVTYRVYVDMLPGWRLQSVYGDANHECRIETTTLFFNNEDRGATTANGINFNYMDDNTVMLDSWVSVGAGASSRLGIQKDQDDGQSTVVNNDGVLQGTNPLAGIPLTQEDGFITGTPEPVTVVGINTELEVFNNQNDGTNGPVFSTNNGAWASLNGSVGPDAALNQVLVAQITTDGIMSFSLNVQIRQDSTFVVENYVASNPQGSEILFPALNYNSASAIGEAVTAESLIFNLYPNPATDMLTIEILDAQTSRNIEYSIYGLAGNLITKGSLGNVSGRKIEKVDVSNLPSGFYVVQMNYDGVASARQFVKH